MDRDVYVKKLKAQLDEWNAQVSKLEAQMWEASEKNKEKYQKYLSDLKEQQSQAEAELEKLRQSSEAAWQEVAEGTKRAWDEYEESLKKAWEQFQPKDK